MMGGVSRPGTIGVWFSQLRSKASNGLNRPSASSSGFQVLYEARYIVASLSTFIYINFCVFRTWLIGLVSYPLYVLSGGVFAV